ncbi:MAG: hypothetical protein U0W40_09760 [Acidimicrobiia bacterium]
MTRLFTDDELAALAMPPRARLEAHLAAGDHDGFAATVREFDRAHRGSVEGYHAWSASTVRHILEEHPEDAAGLFDAIRAFERDYPGERVDLATSPATAPDEVQDLDTWDALVTEWRAHNDLGRDLVSALLSFVYRTHGPDGLEAAIRRGGRDTLMAFLATDISRAPEKRLLSTARMLHGHFTEFTITEDDEKFTIHQDPCGTCTTQITDGRYGAPLDLAVVTEVHPVTGGRGDTPIYRTHIPVMHVLMAREQIGVPWPLPMCPAALGTGPCPSHIFKDPYDPRGNEIVDGPGGWKV